MNGMNAATAAHLPATRIAPRTPGPRRSHAQQTTAAMTRAVRPRPRPTCAQTIGETAVTTAARNGTKAPRHRPALSSLRLQHRGRLRRHHKRAMPRTRSHALLNAGPPTRAAVLRTIVPKSGAEKTIAARNAARAKVADNGHPA